MEKKSISERILDFLDHGICGFSFDSILFILIFVFRVTWDYFLVRFIEENGRQLRFYDNFALVVIGLMAIIVLIRLCLVFFVKDREKPNECFWLIFAYAMFACLSSFLNYGTEMYYDRNIKMNILELLMVTTLMYRTSSTLKETRFQQVLQILGTFLFGLVFLLNVLSVYLYFGTNASVNLFGTVYSHADLFDVRYLDANETQFFGLYGNPSVLGSRVMIALLAGVHLMDKKRLPAFLVIINFLISGFLVYVSDARSAQIEFLILLWFIGSTFFMRRKNVPARKAFGYPMLAGLIGGAAVVILKWKKVAEIFASFFSEPDNPYNKLNLISSGRVSMYMRCIAKANEKPLFGHGWIAYISKLRNAHNIYANALCWTGYTGFAMLCAFTAAVIRRLFKVKDKLAENPYMVCLLLCVFVQSLLDKAILGEMANAETYLFWLCLGYFCFGTRRESKANS